MKFTTKIGEVCFACSATLLAVVMALSTAGAENASVINSTLGTETYRIVDTSDGTEDVDTTYYKATYSDSSALSADYAALCEEVEGEGIVMLKNDGALPLDKGSKVSLFGQGSVNFNYNTTGSSSTSSTSSYATLKDAFEYNSRMSVNPTLWSFYSSSTYTSSYGRRYTASGYTVNEAPYSAFTSDVTNSYYSYSDAAIVVLSRDSGEGSDSTTYGSDGLDGSYLSITEEEEDLLKELTAKKGTVFDSLIVIVNTSLGMQLDFLDGYSGIDVDACLWVGNAGSHGAYAIGAALVGDVNPSGRATDTYLKDNFSSPAMASWAYNTNKKFTQSYSNYNTYGLNVTNRYYGVYVEGIYVGYRYYETRYEDYVMGTANVGSYDYSSDVAYPFGYGLSYSQFEYSNYSVTDNGDETYTVSVDVTNTSTTPGKEVVQVYLQKPYTDYDKTYGVEKASVELVGYAKTAELGYNESETVEIVVDREQFKTYDSNNAQTYILDEGTYYLTAATDSHDAVNNILAAKGYDTSDGMDAEGNADLVAVALEQSSLNTTTYKYSTETGAEITNQFDFCDVNRYSGSGSNSVTYVSRSNWAGTFPKASVSLSVATEEMAQDLESDTALEEDGSEMPTYGASNGISLLQMRGKDYDDEDWDKLLDQMTYAEQALLITDGYHLTNAVTSVIKPATVDENGPTSVTGSKTGYCLPSEGIWAATFNDELIERVGNLLGDDCIMAGVQGLYAPGVNIHRTPFGGRSHEYFSEDPYLTAMAGVAEIKGIQDRGVVAYIKHLAFNNEETNRNGVGVWLNEQSAREIYLLPFEYGMRQPKNTGSGYSENYIENYNAHSGNAHATMTSFNRAGCTWTSASSGLMLNVIRDEWDFDGFAITDASSGNGAYYMTYYDGIMNGTNLYDGTGTSTALDSYKSSARFANMMRESCHRILYVVCNYSAAMNGISPYTVIESVTPWWQTLLNVLEGVSIALIVGSAAVYATALVFKYKKPKKAESKEDDKE